MTEKTNKPQDRQYRKPKRNLEKEGEIRLQELKSSLSKINKKHKRTLEKLAH